MNLFGSTWNRLPQSNYAMTSSGCLVPCRVAFASGGMFDLHDLTARVVDNVLE